jgi:nucleotide-binding universal stress UspA family protein
VGSPAGSGRETILLATDLTEASAAATGRAVDLARRLGARLLVVHVIGGHGPLSRSPGADERRARTEEANLVAERARADGADASFLVWEGEPGDGILAAAEAEGADLIVVGTHDRGSVGRAILGSVSDEVVHRSTIPVLLVRPPEPAPGP